MGEAVVGGVTGLNKYTSLWNVISLVECIPLWELGLVWAAFRRYMRRGLKTYRVIVYRGQAQLPQRIFNRRKFLCCQIASPQ